MWDIDIVVTSTVDEIPSKASVLPQNKNYMHQSFNTLPLVLGKIQVTAQWILRGQPLKTLEKQAPIYRTSTATESLMVRRGYIDTVYNIVIFIHTEKSNNVSVRKLASQYIMSCIYVALGYFAHR